MARIYSQAIVQRLMEFFEKEKWRYRFDSEEGVFYFGLNLEKRVNIQYALDVHGFSYITYGMSPFHGDPKDSEMMTQIARFLSMANYGLKYGNFEINMADGDIRYKCSVDCEDITLSDSVIKTSIHVPAIVFEQYSKGIVQIIFNNMTAEEAIYLCEGDDGM